MSTQIMSTVEEHKTVVHRFVNGFKRRREHGTFGQFVSI